MLLVQLINMPLLLLLVHLSLIVHFARTKKRLLVQQRNIFLYCICYDPPEREPGIADNEIFKQQSVGEV
jgi:hypothetical protein